MSEYCPAGKINCENCSLNKTGDLICEIDYSGVAEGPASFERCPFPSRQRPVDEKITLELTPEQACELWHASLEGSRAGSCEKAFGCMMPTDLISFSQLDNLKRDWDDKHAEGENKRNRNERALYVCNNCLDAFELKVGAVFVQKENDKIKYCSIKCFSEGNDTP